MKISISWIVILIIIALGGYYLYSAQTVSVPVTPSGQMQTSNNPQGQDYTPPSGTNTSTQIRGLTIDLSNKGLTKAPEYIFKESATETLNLSNNKLTGALQAEIRFLANLRVLDLSNNDFTGVPAEIGQLKNLEVLNLSGNPITGLPYELANLKKLRSLDLRGTKYSAQDLDVIKKGLPSDVVIYLK